MALNPAALQTVIEDLNNANGQGNFPTTDAAAAAAWAQAAYDYAVAVVPASTTAAAAQSAFETAFQNAVGDPLTPAFTVFANTLGGGMAGFTYTLGGALDLTVVFAAGFAGADAATQAVNLTGEIDTWFKSHTATNINTGTTSNWS